MGQMIQFSKVEIVKHETPKVAKLKSGDVVYQYRVTIHYFGGSMSRNATDLNDALEYVRENAQVYQPTWEEVTGNGRYSCE